MEELTKAVERLQIDNDRIAGRFSKVPRFHYPFGIPHTKDETVLRLSKIASAFLQRSKCIKVDDVSVVTRAMNLPLYTRRALCKAICECANLNFDTTPEICFRHFTEYWKT